MVSRQANERKTIRVKVEDEGLKAQDTDLSAGAKTQGLEIRQSLQMRRTRRLPAWILGMVALGLVFAIAGIIYGLNRGGMLGGVTGVSEGANEDQSAYESSENTPVTEVPSESETGVEELPDAVTAWQGVVEKWAASVSGNKSVLIYDLDREEVAASYNTSEKYIMESLYKLFVVYEGYRMVANGTWDANMMISDTGQTLLACLDKAIRSSDSDCAEPIWEMIGQTELDRIAHEEWGISDNTDISSILSNVEDITKIMRRFYEHPDFDDTEMMARMWDSFLVQPSSGDLCYGPCNWRQGLPSGFSAAVDVYNKVGWRWDADKNRWETYHDAAIVHFKNTDRWFAIVVMTNHVPYRNIRELATMLEKTF